MAKQTTNSLLMIQPVAFGYNPETAVNNHYQNNLPLLNARAQKNALLEFNNFVKKLREHKINVVVVPDTLKPETPDSIFPNNWISFHENSQVAIYPMFAENRRNERREDILDILDEEGFKIENIIDYSSAEEEEVFLEGTGSMILDREHEVAYMALSPRANEELFIEFCEDFEYTPIIFNAYQTVDDARELIYHTNVMMCIADKFAVICLDAIDNKKERKTVVKALRTSDKEIIDITEEQVNQFAGNMLQVHNSENQKFLVMSTAAYKALNQKQITQIEKHNPIIHSSLSTIETLGGGSARCMMAEIFLNKK